MPGRLRGLHHVHTGASQSAGERPHLQTTTPRSHLLLRSSQKAVGQVPIVQGEIAIRRNEGHLLTAEGPCMMCVVMCMNL